MTGSRLSQSTERGNYSRTGSASQLLHVRFGSMWHDAVRCLSGWVVVAARRHCKFPPTRTMRGYGDQHCFDRDTVAGRLLRNTTPYGITTSLRRHSEETTIKVWTMGVPNASLDQLGARRVQVSRVPPMHRLQHSRLAACVMLTSLAIWCGFALLVFIIGASQKVTTLAAPVTNEAVEAIDLAVADFDEPQVSPASAIKGDRLPLLSSLPPPSQPTAEP